MRYACLIYYDEKKLFGGAPESEEALSQCRGYGDVLKESGHYVAGEALVLTNEAITVSVRDGSMSTVDGPFMETKEMLGGFILVEARDLNEAVRLAAGHPLAKIGRIEVRAVVDFTQPRPVL